jgi:uncharacterized damage-inducible protein DinB
VITDIKQFFLKQKQAIHDGTVSVFKKIPAEDLHYRPAEGMLTLGEIVRHCWMSERGARSLALHDDWSYYEKRIPAGLEGILGTVTSLEEELENLRAQHLITLREAGEFPLENWDDQRRNDVLMMDRRVSVLLYGINEHQAHHRAQVGLLIRMRTGQRASAYLL